MAELYGWAIKIKNLDADHTYVTSSDGGVWPCWGRSAGGHKIASGIGSSKRANCLSQSSSHAGLIYGVTGVCHQTSNRILYPSRKLVNKAKGYWASVLLYGTYGTHNLAALIEWEARKARCKKVSGDLGRSKAKLGAAKLKALRDKPLVGIEKGIVGYTKNVRDIYVKQRADVKITAAPPLVKRTKALAKELDLMADFKLDKKEARKIKPLKKLQAAVHKEKDELDHALVGKDLSAVTYARRVNGLLGELLQESADRLSEESYTKLFDLKPGKKFRLVDPDILAKYHK